MIESFDPVSLPLWLLAAFAAAQYPLALMFGAECSLCCCRAVCNPQFEDCCGDTFARLSGGVCCGGVWYSEEEHPIGECCADVWHTGPGVCCDEPTTVPILISSCTGSGAAAIAIKDGDVVNARVVEPGSGYAVIGREEPTLTVSGGSGTGLVVVPSLEQIVDNCGLPRWRISSVSFSGGTGYRFSPATTIPSFYVPPCPPGAPSNTGAGAPANPGAGGGCGGYFVPERTIPQLDTEMLTVTAAAGDTTVLHAALAVRSNSSGVPQAVLIVNQGLYYRNNPQLAALVPAVTAAIDPAYGSGATLSVEVDTDTSSPTFGQITAIEIDDLGQSSDEWSWQLAPVWHEAGEEGECCGEVWYREEGECCREEWYPADDPCPDGQVYITVDQFGQECCGCFPDEVYDPRVPGLVPTLNVVDDLMCCCNFLSFGVDAGDNQIPCVQRCCTPSEEDENILLCTTQSQESCEAGGGESLAGCCDLGCPAGCCTEDADGVSQCENKNSGECISEGGYVIWPDCENAECLGECCIDGVSQGQLTQEECDAIEGFWSGVGETECIEGCRAPFDENCCETVVSDASGLTFTQPRRKSSANADALWLANVSGTTDSPILIHGVPFGQNATPARRCPFNLAFDMCYDHFNVEPLPCNSSFRRLDITVCWSPAGDTLEELDYSGCNDITLWLGHCIRECETIVRWAGQEITVGAAVELRGAATIESNGTGPMRWPAITAINVGGCNATLTLAGTNADVNTIGEINNSPGPNVTVVGIAKRGPGRWRITEENDITGFSYLYEGTLEVAVTTTQAFGAFGSSPQRLPIGEVGAHGGVARLLIGGSGVSFQRWFDVLDSGRAVEIGSYTPTTNAFSDPTAYIYHGGPFTMYAATGGTLEFYYQWTNGDGTGPPDADVTFGKDEVGEGTVWLTNNCRTSGTVTVTHGLLWVRDTLGQFENAEVVVVDGSTAELRYTSDPDFTRPLDLNAGTFSGDVDVQGLVTVGGNATVNVETDDTIIFSGGLAGASGTLTKDGPGTLAITSTSTFAGTLRITDGVVLLAGNTSLASVEIAASCEIRVDDGEQAAITSSLSGDDDLVKLGAGTLTITADSSTFSGVLIMNAGTLAGDTEISSVAVAGASTISVDAGDEIAVTFELGGAGTLAKIGAGTLRLTGSYTLPALLTLSDGTLAGNVDISGPAAIGGAMTINVESGDDITFSGGLTGSAVIEKDGDGTLNFGVGNAWTGELTVNAGTVDVAEIYTNPSSLATGATITSTTVTVAFSSTPASGAQYRILPGSIGNTITTVTLTGTAATGTFNVANSTLTIN